MPIEKFLGFLGTFLGYVVVLAIFDVPIDFPPFDRWWVGMFSLIIGVLCGISIHLLNKIKLVSNTLLAFTLPFIISGVGMFVLLFFFEPHAYLLVFLLGTFITSSVLGLALNEDNS